VPAETSGQSVTLRYVYRVTPNDDLHIVVRVDESNAANAFARADVMRRNRPDACRRTFIATVEN
jgi:hypothetical protein